MASATAISPCVADRVAAAVRRGSALGRTSFGSPRSCWRTRTHLAAGRPNDAELTSQHIGEVIPGASSSLYGLAIVAAKAGDRPKALEQLREAVKRKLPNPEKIASEAAVAPMNVDPELRALVAQAVAK